MTAQDARDWYERWYVPNNAYVVIVGDVDHKAVFRAAEKYYGGLKSRPLPLRKPGDEPVQTRVRRVVVKAPAELPVVIMGYRAPVVRDVEKDLDPYALDMLGRGSLRAWGGAFQQASRPRAAPRRFGRGRIRLDGARAGHVLPDRHALRRASVNEMEAGLRAELARVQADGVSAEELNRAKAQLVAGQIYKLDSMFAQAMEIGQLEAGGAALHQRRADHRASQGSDGRTGTGRRPSLFQ